MNLYWKAADILKDTNSKRSDVKKSIFKHKDDKYFKTLYSMVSGIKSCEAQLDSMLKSLIDIEPEAASENENLLKVLLYELVVQNRKIRIGGRVIRFVKRNLASLKSNVEIKSKLIKKKISLRVRNVKLIPEELKSASKPIEGIPKIFSMDYETYSDFNKQHFPLYKHRNFVLQSVSSSIPVFFLWKLSKSIPRPFSIVEACSAPGNKTLQLSDYFRACDVFSFEKNFKRFGILKERLQFYLKSKEKDSNQLANVKIINSDYFEALKVLTSEQANSVKVACLDPSCSGSGMLNRVNDSLVSFEKEDLEKLLGTKESEEKERVEKLSEFQFEIVDATMKSFPNLELVSYSTCSLYKEENEDVVKKLLISNPDFDLVKLPALFGASRAVNFWDENWSKISRGLRFSPNGKETDGFFVAIFRKKLRGNN